MLLQARIRFLKLSLPLAPPLFIRQTVAVADQLAASKVREHKIFTAVAAFGIPSEHIDAYIKVGSCEQSLHPPVYAHLPYGPCRVEPRLSWRQEEAWTDTALHLPAQKERWPTCR